MIALNEHGEHPRSKNKLCLILIQRLGILLEIVIRHVRHLLEGSQSETA